MLKRYIIFGFILLIFYGLAGVSELSQFECGRVKADFYYYLDMFSGWDSGINHAGQFRENPALLAASEDNTIKTSISPGIKIDAGSLYPNFRSNINEELESLVSGVKSDSLEIGFPEMDLHLAQAGGIRELTSKIETGKGGCWGISMWKPLVLGGAITGNSFLMTLRTDAGIREEEETKIVLGNDFRIGMNIEMSQIRTGYVHRLNNGINIGLGFDILNLQIEGDGYTRTEGFIRQFGGDTDISQAFNDPQDSQYFRNTLDNVWQSDFEETLLGFNGGLSYQIGERTLIDLGISQPYHQEVSGNSELIVHGLGAVNYESLIGESEEELFDELLLEPSKMTYTYETVYSCKSLIFNYPGILRLGLGIDNGRTQHQISMSTYPGELSLRYQGKIYETGREKTGNHFEDYEKTADVDYTYGIKLKSKLEYNLSHLLSDKLGIFMTLQYYSLEEVMDNIKDENGAEIEPETLMNLITGNFGMSWQISRNLTADCLIFGFPGPFMKLNLVYNLGNKL